MLAVAVAMQFHWQLGFLPYLIGRDELQKQQSEELVEKNFKGSLPMFVNAFLGGGKKMSKEDAQSLIDMIEQHTEE